MKGNTKRGVSWCDSCDSDKVQHGVKCSVCGIRSKSSKLKKTKLKIEDYGGYFMTNEQIKANRIDAYEIIL
jgi:hypothetical protein